MIRLRPVQRMPDRAIRKSNAGTERDARPGIGSTHDRIGFVAARIQATDRLAISLGHPRPLIDDKARGRANIARVKPHGIERRSRDRPKRRIRAMGGVSIVAMISRGAATEIWIDAGDVVRIEASAP